MRLRLRALERPQRHLGSLAFLADASTHEEILLPIWPDVCHYDGWSPNISARDRVPTVAKSVDFCCLFTKNCQNPASRQLVLALYQVPACTLEQCFRTCQSSTGLDPRSIELLVAL